MDLSKSTCCAPQIDWRGLCDQGFSLIPVQTRSKLPVGKWARFQHERATSDEITHWQRAGFNAGIVTGAISNLVALDCDSLEAVEEAHRLGVAPDTVTVRTAKGAHLYFRHPGFAVPNKARFLPGMDLRGDGGFVVAPGSIHPNGAAYEWINHPAWHEIAPMPGWLASHLERMSQPAAAIPTSPIVAESAYGIAARDRELAALRNTSQGRRNDQLNRSAFALAQLSAAGELNSEDASATLRAVALEIGLEPDEIERTIASGWSAGLREPRQATTGNLSSGIPPRIISAPALAAMNFPPLRWAIPGLLPEGLAILAGKPKFGKSFLALQMGAAIAGGVGGTLGVEIEAGDVLYCALEDSPRRLHARLRQIYPFGGLPERFHLATEWPRLGQGAAEFLEAWCDTHPTARLIILDTWRAIKPQASGRGSAYDEDANAAAPLLEFTKRRSGLAVIVVHHVRKMDADDIFDTISGTHGLTGIFDTQMVLARHGGSVKLAAQGRDLEGYEKILERDRRTGGWKVMGDAVAIAKTGERQELLDLLAESDAPLSLAALAKAVGKKPDTTRHLLKALIEEALVHQPGHGLYSLAPSQFAQSPQSEGEENPF